MKKLILKIFGILLFLLCLTSCEMGGGSSSGGQEIVKLSQPVVKIENNFLIWEEVDNAEYYEVYLNNTLKEKVTELEYDFSYLTAGTYTLKVRACNDRSSYEHSLFAAVKFVKELSDAEKTKLSMPVLRIQDDILIWNSVLNALGYEIYIDDVLVETVSELKYDLKSLDGEKHSIKVRTIGDDKLYLPSDYSLIEYIPGTEMVSDEYTVFMINDTHSAFNNGDFPGFSKVSTLVNELEKKHGEIIKIGNGDLFQGSYISNIFYGLPIIEGMNLMEFDAFVLGNHDFDWGLDKIYAYYDGDLTNGEAEFPVLGANVYDKKTNQRVDWVDPYTVVEKNGVKVGIIGLIGYSLESSILAENVADYDFVYPITLVSDYAKELREQLGCDSVIVSIHDYDEELNAEIAKLSGSSTIDAIYCGHTHQKISETETHTNGVKIPVVENNDKNRTAVSVTLNITNYQFTVNTYYPSNYKEDSEMLELVAKYQKYIDEGDEIIGYTSSSMNKSKLGMIAVDSMKEYFDADVAIINTAGIRATISSGNITRTDIFEVFPFNNKVILVELTGSKLKSLYNRNSDFLYVSSGFNVNNLNNNTVYKIAVIDYVFTGTYYSEFRNAPYTDTGILMRDIFIEYIIEKY